MTGLTGQSADIWLLDRALRWHYMAPTFVNYYCQMMIHVGLPQWQLTFTDFGLLPQAKVTFYPVVSTCTESETAVLNLAEATAATITCIYIVT